MAFRAPSLTQAVVAAQQHPIDWQARSRACNSITDPDQRRWALYQLGIHKTPPRGPIKKAKQQVEDE